jgi:hypothetical protein
VGFLDSLHLSPSTQALLAGGSFVYLKRVRGGGFYDLCVCEQSEVEDSDYLTLSSTGVTHFQRLLVPGAMGAAPVREDHSSFATLAQFTREHRLYHMIHSIPFFRTYRGMLEPCAPRATRTGAPRAFLPQEDPKHFSDYRGSGSNPGGKAFDTWKRAVRGARCQRAASALEARLFLLNPTLRPTLLAIVVEGQVALGSRRQLLALPVRLCNKVGRELQVRVHSHELLLPLCQVILQRPHYALMLRLHVAGIFLQLPHPPLYALKQRLCKHGFIAPQGPRKVVHHVQNEGGQPPAVRHAL